MEQRNRERGATTPERYIYLGYICCTQTAAQLERRIHLMQLTLLFLTIVFVHSLLLVKNRQDDNRR